MRSQETTLPWASPVKADKVARDPQGAFRFAMHHVSSTYPGCEVRREVEGLQDIEDGRDRHDHVLPREGHSEKVILLQVLSVISSLSFRRERIICNQADQ